MASPDTSFRPALIVVDMQEDFCPPVSYFATLLRIPMDRHRSTPCHAAQVLILSSILTTPHVPQYISQPTGHTHAAHHHLQLPPTTCLRPPCIHPYLIPHHSLSLLPTLSPTSYPSLFLTNQLTITTPPSQSGSLAVSQGRSIIPLINTLLALPTFALRLGTKDWHPPNHISFASNHPGKHPFIDTCTVTNPHNSLESYETRLWPDHCIQDTRGAELADELDAGLFDKVIEKGTDHRVEMYSAFYDPLKNPRVSDSGLAKLLKEARVTHVYVVGLAGDYCVRCTAADAHAEGFTTYVVEEGTRAVDSAGWEACKAEIQEGGVSVVSKDGPEVRRLFDV